MICVSLITCLFTCQRWSINNTNWISQAFWIWQTLRHHSMFSTLSISLACEHIRHHRHQASYSTKIPSYNTPKTPQEPEAPQRRHAFNAHWAPGNIYNKSTKHHIHQRHLKHFKHYRNLRHDRYLKHGRHTNPWTLKHQHDFWHHDYLAVRQTMEATWNLILFASIQLWKL